MVPPANRGARIVDLRRGTSLEVWTSNETVLRDAVTAVAAAHPCIRVEKKASGIAEQAIAAGAPL